MKKLLCGLVCLWCCHALALEVVDDRGVTVTLASPPQRIVSLLPSLTELVCELGACARMVGVDDHSNWPLQVQGLPRMGGLEDASIEKILALQPDVVLLAGSARAVARLEAVGLKVVALEPRTLADVKRVLATVGLLLGVADTVRVWERIDSGIAAAAASLPRSARGTSVYFEVSSAPYAASEASFIGELLSRIGAVNVVPGRLGPFPKLNPEFVVRADPQVVMLTQRSTQALDSRPGWRRIRAVRNGRICTFSQAQADVLVRPGPRMDEAARLMVRCLQGQLQAPAP